jgi:uncharacterized protein (DUF433 family)
MMPTNQYVEFAMARTTSPGRALALITVIWDLRRGSSAKDILEAYPSLGSLEKVHGAITFIQEHPVEVEDYLKQQDRIFEEIKVQYPMPADMIERFERGRRELLAKRS